MTTFTDETTLHTVQEHNNRCPFQYRGPGQQKTSRIPEYSSPLTERDSDGIWHVRNVATARAILRSEETRQAGFKTELLLQLPQLANMPILFQDGQTHHQQRRKTARFFAPRTVSEHYRPLMERFSDRIIAYLKKQGHADLHQLSTALAVRVAAQVVGLTDSIWPGMARRLHTFFTTEVVIPGWDPRTLYPFLVMQKNILSFLYMDVKPAIRKRRKQAQHDVISHLIEQGYSDMEILTECITYAAAGMITTREFICIAAWHLLEQPDLRSGYLHADEEQRHAILHEILRLEPVVGNLLRKTTSEIIIDQPAGAITIPQHALIDLHIYAINTDEDIVGTQPYHICPGRGLGDSRISAAVMSFGDGHHRCPGAYVAIQESDIFLQRLLALESLTIERKPSISWNDLIKGYELNDFLVRL